MKTNQTIIENGSLKDVSYESPKCVVINVESEGVLCSSNPEGNGMENFVISQQIVSIQAFGNNHLKI